MTTKPRVQWTDQNISTASRFWADGKTMTDLAQYFNVSRSTVSGMIARNRDKFEVRNGADAAPLRKRIGGKSQGVRNKARNPTWTEAQFAIAIALWVEGKSLRRIGAALGLSASTVQSVTVRFADRFPKRSNARTGRPSYRNAPRSNEPVRGFVGNPESQASERYDFTRYQIENTDPVAYWKLTGCQCHFPLEKFEAVSGPDTPCCGQENLEGRAYCNTHWKLMHEVRVR